VKSTIRQQCGTSLQKLHRKKEKYQGRWFGLAPGAGQIHLTALPRVVQKRRKDCGGQTLSNQTRTYRREPMVSLQAAFAAMILSAPGQTVLLDFYADWCGPCRAMETSVRAIQEKGYPVQKVNIDQSPSLAAQFGVRSVPCFIMLVDGREVDRVLGGTSYSRLERMCKIAGEQLPDRPPNMLAQNETAPQNPALPPNALLGSGPGQISFPVHEDSNVVPASFQPSAGATPVPAQPWSAAPPQGALAGPVTGGQSALPGPNLHPSGNTLEAKLVAASVRLRIEDPNGNSCGSGTIIDARGGEALILTCGHIFRDSQGKGKIEVDLFGPYAGQEVAGRLVSYDLQRDVGLVSIRTPGPIAATPLAPPAYKVHKGDKVASVGCDNGQDPAVRNSYVTSIDRYAGPSNLQVAGQPTEGRSGGGLFSADGLLIGVCNARDPQDQEGFYAALDTIRVQLDQAGVAFVYQSPQSQDGLSGTLPMLSAVSPSATTPQMPRTISPAVNPIALAGNMGQAIGAPATSPAGLSPTEQAALEEIRRRVKEGAEVVCVVRSRSNPLAKSEVIMIDKASPAFVEQLAAEAKAQQGPQLTSLEVPKPKQPALQWPGNAQGWRSGQ
jgi:thiol-disulfide isomerase/thioredoxin